VRLSNETVVSLQESIKSYSVWNCLFLLLFSCCVYLLGGMGKWKNEKIRKNMKKYEKNMKKYEKIYFYLNIRTTKSWIDYPSDAV
jgi:hypothetical protein